MDSASELTSSSTTSSDTKAPVTTASPLMKTEEELMSQGAEGVSPRIHLIWCMVINQ